MALLLEASNFGDKFKTKNGLIALYMGKSVNYNEKIKSNFIHELIVENFSNTFYYTDDDIKRAIEFGYRKPKEELILNEEP